MLCCAYVMSFLSDTISTVDHSNHTILGICSRKPKIEWISCKSYLCLSRYQQVVFPLCTEIQLGVIAQFGFKPDGEGIIQFTQVLAPTFSLLKKKKKWPNRMTFSHSLKDWASPILSQVSTTPTKGKGFPCPFLATSPQMHSSIFDMDLMFCSAHQADGEGGPGGGQVGSACQELLHPSGKTSSQKTTSSLR